MKSWRWSSQNGIVQVTRIWATSMKPWQFGNPKKNRGIFGGVAWIYPPPPRIIGHQQNDILSRELQAKISFSCRSTDSKRAEWGFSGFQNEGFWKMCPHPFSNVSGEFLKRIFVVSNFGLVSPKFAIWKADVFTGVANSVWVSESHLTFPLKGTSFVKKDERFLLGFVASSGGREHPKFYHTLVP